MLSLLDAAKDYIDNFRGIRISTRPDAIDEEILSVLLSYKVTSIELGAQSMSDKVLLLNNRGHNSDCVRKASELIKSRGISLGLQMMTGLYGSDDATDKYTAEEFIKLSPDTVRIYPTVVIKNTALAQYMDEGKYTPHSVDSAVSLCSELIPMFEDANINIIRVGLHSSDTMEDNIVGGAYHPAFRELCENRIFYNNILELLKKNSIKEGKVTICVSPSAVSKATGQKKSNLTKLRELGFDANIISDESLHNRQIIIQEG